MRACVLAGSCWQEERVGRKHEQQARRARALRACAALAFGLRLRRDTVSAQVSTWRRWRLVSSRSSLSLLSLASLSALPCFSFRFLSFVVKETEREEGNCHLSSSLCREVE